MSIIAGGCASDIAATGGPSAPGRTATPSTAVASPSTATTPTASAAASIVPTGTWQRAAPMIHGRKGFDAVLIGENDVLAVGDDHACQPGGAVQGSERAEIYLGDDDAWHETGSLNKPRKSFATVVSRDSSLAMVIGGLNEEDVPFSSTKVFDPEGDRWADGPLLNVARADPRAVVAARGRIVVVSEGRGGETTMSWTTEVLDVDGQRWSRADPTLDLHGDLVPLDDGRVIHAAVAFESGAVMRAFDPEAGRWSDFPAPGFDRISTLVPLHGGDVLAFGMVESELGLFASQTVMRYLVADGRWTEVASIPTARSGAQIAVGRDGRVIVAGGLQVHADIAEEILDVTEIYDPAADRWLPGPDLLEPRRDGLAVALGDGSILVLGGDQALNTEGDTPFCPPAMTSVERLYPAP